MLAESEQAFELGTKFGSSIGSIIPVVFLVIAVRSFFQNDRNKKCALSMILLTAGWSAMTVGYALSTVTGATGILFPLFIMGSLLVLAAIAFAILGLLQLSGSTRPQVGKTQAVLSLVFSGLFFLFAGIGAVRGERGIPDDWKMIQPLPGSRISVVSKNFSIGFPGPDWIQIVPEKLNKHAEVAFVQPKKRIYLIILAHQVAGANLTPLNQFAEGARKEMAQVAPGALVDEAQPFNVGPCQGAVFSAEAGPEGKPLNYREWVSIHGSVAYQVLAWGAKADADIVRRETDAIVGTFETLAP